MLTDLQQTRETLYAIQNGDEFPSQPSTDSVLFIYLHMSSI